MADTHRARKRFGQHFLCDAGIIARIVSSVNPRPDEHLVEIGPGLGAITRPLLEAAGELEAVELDRDVIAHLERRCAGAGTLRVHSADALAFDFARLRTDRRPLRLVGNLPYNISTPLLFHLVRFAAHVQDMHFMLQREVVERMAAAPGDDAYGRLSVMLQYHCRVEPLFLIGPEAFDPPPRVDSAFVRVVPHAAPPVAVRDPRQLADVVRLAFAQRRKTLRNCLRSVLEADTIAAAGIDPGARPETLSLAQFATLANALPEAARNPSEDSA